MKTTLFAVVSALALGIAPAAEPFEWRAADGDTGLTISVAVADNFYLYADSLMFRVSGGDGSAPELVSAPAPVLHRDEELGQVKIYPAGVWRWQWRGAPPFAAEVAYQGCRKAADGEPALCMMPSELRLLPRQESPIRVLEGKLATLPESGADFRLVGRIEGAVTPEELISRLRSGKSDAPRRTDAPERGFPAMILLALLGGIALNLTPCVLPMIPVNLMIIGASGTSRRAGFRRGLCYGAGMAAAYGVLGGAVVLAGGSLRFGELNSSATFNFIIGAIFLVLAAAMAGLLRIDFSGRFRIRPSALKTSQNVAALLLGAVAALLAGACVAPVVITVLLFAAERSAAGNPAAALLPLALGVGMALPWPFAGAGLAVLPKPGKFMNTVKYLFAAVILAVAGYYAYVGWSLLPGKFAPQKELAKLESAMAEARRENKMLVVDLWASWCKNCAQLERTTLADQRVRAELEKFVFVKIQAEKLSDPGIRALLDRWGVNGLPALVVLRPPDANFGQTLPTK